MSEQVEKKMDLLANQCKMLLASFDTVQIFCTKTDKETGDTADFAFGDGNYWARYGHIKQWTLKQEERQPT